MFHELYSCTVFLETVFLETDKVGFLKVKQAKNIPSNRQIR